MMEFMRRYWRTRKVVQTRCAQLKCMRMLLSDFNGLQIASTIEPTKTKGG